MIYVLGGGAPLNYKVVGGTSAPSSPSENTIWVNTSTAITSHVFSATQPTGSAGMVWISTGTASQAQFNALKKNGIQVYPLSAKQYVSGKWVDKTAKSYQGGKWVEWIIYLYKSGTWSGTKIQKNGGSASCADNGTSYSFNSSNTNNSYYYLGVECDLTAFKTLNARFDSASGDHVGMFITNSATPNYLSLYDGRDTVAYKLGCVKGVNSISISNLSGIKFVWFGVYGDNTLSTGTVSEFYLS